MGDIDPRGLRAAVLAYTMWGLLTLYWKQLAGLDAFEMVGWRVVTAAVLMAVIVTVTGRRDSVLAAVRSRTVGPRLVLAALLLLGNWSTYVWAVIHDHVLETALGYFLAPLGTSMLGIVVLGERLTPLKRASIACAIAAVLVLTLSYGRVPWIALVLAGSWSWYGLTKRRVPLDPIESLSAELTVVALPALLLVALGFARDGGIPDQAIGTDWLWLIGTGAITAAPLLLFADAAQRLPFTVLGPTNYLVPIINFLLGWLVFDEALTASRLAGFVLVWVALALVTADMLRSRGPRIASPPDRITNAAR